MSKERAIQLRLEGKSRREIAEALGLKTGGGALSRWLKDVPPPEWTKRPRAKDDLRSQAIELRRQGRSYREITEALGVVKSTLSGWLSGLDLTEQEREGLTVMRKLARTQAGRTMQAARIARRHSTVTQAAGQIAFLAESELFVAGVATYWAEGAKAKTWRRGEGVSLINSDANLIRLFLRWLELIGIEKHRLSFRLSIHETADVAAATRYWAAIVGIDTGDFMRPTIKKHKPNTKRKNVGENYHGCVTVRVRRSTELSRQIEGWWQGIVKGADNLTA